MTSNSVLVALRAAALLVLAGLVQTALAADPCTACNGFPDKDRNSGRFITVTRGEATLGDTGTGESQFNISIRISGSIAVGQTFELGIFDGDMNGPKQDSGANLFFYDTAPTGSTPDQLTYFVIPDPMHNGAQCVDAACSNAIFSVSSTGMPDNDWAIFNITQTMAAKDTATNTGDFFYHVLTLWTTKNNVDEENLFKISVQGTPFLLAGATIGFIGVVNVPNPPVGFNEIAPNNISYGGDFHFAFFVPNSTTSISLWDGDADRKDDTDDPNSPAFPPFPHSPLTVAQGVNPGNPPDDNTGTFFVVPPNIFYTVSDPTNTVIATNNNPSGNQEWELFKIGLNGQCVTPTDCDTTVAALPPGLYHWDWHGVDAENNIFVHPEFDLFACPNGTCTPPPCPAGQVCTPPCVSSIASNFNGTSIPAGQSVWFNSVMKVSGQGSTTFSIDVVGQSAVSAAFNVPLPNAHITFDSTATTATTTFDAGTNTWITTVPLGYTGNVFLSGAMLPLPSGLQGGLNPVTWTGSFIKPASVKVDWQWAAAAYNTLLSTTGIGVKSVDSNSLDATYKNSDHAGTPESVKSLMGNGGARGGGGSNFTGSYSGTGHACVN
jgi:hypothetical protein